MSKLTEFLTEHTVENVTLDINLGGRLIDFSFKIKAMSGPEFNRYQKTATKQRGKKVDFDTSLFNEKVIINQTMEPNFKDAEFIGGLGVQTPEQAMYKVLLSGEIAELSKQISELSGFNRDIELDVDEAKNS